MNGVTVLAVNSVGSGMVETGAVVILWGVIFTLCIIMYAVIEDKPCAGFFCIVSVLVIFWGVSIIKNETYKNEYIVTISDTVSIKEFSEKYTIESQNGQLYTITENEDTNK